MAFTTWILLIFCSFQLFEPGYGQNWRRGIREKFISPSSYLAYLNVGKNEYCAGALVSVRYVLTAASCVRKEVEIVLGKHSLNPGLQSTYTVSNKDFILNGPIALVKLPKPANLNRAARIMDLSKRDRYDNVRFLGWRKPRSRPERAYGFDVSVVRREECQDQYYPLTINETDLCIDRINRWAYPIETTGAILFHNTLRTLIGIGHRSYEVRRTDDRPLLITNIKSYREWIEEQIKSEDDKETDGDGKGATDASAVAKEDTRTENNGTATTGVPEISEGDNSTEANGTATSGTRETSGGDNSTEAKGTATTEVHAGISEEGSTTENNGTATTGVPGTSRGDKATEANGAASR